MRSLVGTLDEINPLIITVLLASKSDQSIEYASITASLRGAGHFDFLPPCDEALARNAPMICAPTPGFDRAAFHQTFNAEVVAFFQTTL